MIQDALLIGVDSTIDGPVAEFFYENLTFETWEDAVKSKRTTTDSKNIAGQLQIKGFMKKVHSIDQ